MSAAPREPRDELREADALRWEFRERLGAFQRAAGGQPVGSAHVTRVNLWQTFEKALARLPHQTQEERDQVSGKP